MITSAFWVASGLVFEMIEMIIRLVHIWWVIECSLIIINRIYSSAKIIMLHLKILLVRSHLSHWGWYTHKEPVLHSLSNCWSGLSHKMIVIMMTLWNSGCVGLRREMHLLIENIVSVGGYRGNNLLERVTFEFIERLFIAEECPFLSILRFVLLVKVILMILRY